MQQPVKFDTSALLSDKQIKREQDIVGTIVWYSRAYDPKLPATISDIASRQDKGTDDVMAACHQLLEYLATQPDVAIRYHEIDMILFFETDASYLSELGGKIWAAAY